MLQIIMILDFNSIRQNLKCCSSSINPLQYAIGND